MPKIEQRHISTGLEIRAAAEGSASLGTVEGYAALFNSKAEIYRYRDEVFMEEIAPGAFDDVLNDDVRCLFNHSENNVLARTKSGTLTISSDKKGLKYSFEIPDTSLGRDLKVMLERGDVSQSSFSFRVLTDTVLRTVEDGKNVYTRTIIKMKSLRDVAPVTYPAYQDTTVSLRNDYEALKSRATETDTDKGKMEILRLVQANRERNR